MNNLKQLSDSDLRILKTEIDIEINKRNRLNREFIINGYRNDSKESLNKYLKRYKQQIFNARNNREYSTIELHIDVLQTLINQ